MLGNIATLNSSVPFYSAPYENDYYQNLSVPFFIKANKSIN